MIACAMGIPRGESVSHLEALQMKVIGIAGGVIEQDFQTVREAATNDGSSGRSAITTRHYIPDYCAEIELSGEDALIDVVEYAIKFPRWQLYVGRRSNVPDRPLIASK